MVIETLRAIGVKHYLIAPLLLFQVFGVGFQPIPVFIWLYFPLSILYARRAWANVAILYVVNTIGATVAMAGMFDGVATAGKLQHPGVVLALSALGNLNAVAAFAADRFAQKYSRQLWLRVLLFPCVWTGLWHIYGPLLGFGDTYVYSNALTISPDLLQLAALGGRSFIDFVVALFGTVALEARHIVVAPFLVDADAPPSARRHLFRHPAVLYAIVMVVLAVYTGAKVNIHENSMYQNGYPNYVPPTTPVGCVVGPGGIHYELQSNHTHWFEKTAQLAKAGAKLVLWSEETALVKGQEEEATFFESLKALSQEHRIYLAATYDFVGTKAVENKLVLIGPEGDVLINYNKAYPVPFVEPQPPGPRVFPFVDTPEFGRIGAGICFDYSFSSFIHQASRNHVDVMLQASWTWGPIGTYHIRNNAVRAVENGATLFRCASQGISGVYEPTANGIFNQQVASISDESYMFYLPLQKRVWTLYSVIGDSFAYGCLVFGFIGIVYLIRCYVLERRQRIELE